MMKKIKVILMLLVIILSVVSFCGCAVIEEILKNTNPENRMSTVDGYEVYSVFNRNSDDTYAIIGVDDSKIVKGVWTVPETVGGRAVSGLGYSKSIFMAGYKHYSMTENDNIKKIVVNHELLLSGQVFVNLTGLREVQFNEHIDFFMNENGISFYSIYSLTATHPRNTFEKLIRQMPDLRCVTLINPQSSLWTNRKYIFSYPSCLVAYFMPEAEQVDGVFSEYTSLSVFIVEDTVTEVSQKAFKDSTVDVYVRYSKDNCPEGLLNGWDDGVNVIWGFEDEIVIFDSLFGSEIVFDSTNKNYVVAKVGDKLVPPTAPTREGYEFTGWYKDYACTELWNYENDTVSTSTVLVAGWQEL